MKKPINNDDNFKRCICGDCTKYINRICNKEIPLPVEKLYCAGAVSNCRLGQGICVCPGCPVYKENGLAGAVFCIKEITTEESNKA